MTAAAPLRSIGRYTLAAELAAGGMASVHLAHMVGPAGFSRLVAVKRIHPRLADDASVRRMFLDEARLASRIRHPNVVEVLDVVSEPGGSPWGEPACRVSEAGGGGTWARVA